MSQRNFMNDRYQDEGPKGTTRKSAASAKPKTKAAASVHIQSSTKTPQQKKAEQKAKRKAERAKQNELDRKYYNPPTAEYKRLRRLWWVVLIAAVVMVALSWFARSWEPVWISYVTLGLSYALIILAFYIDFSKIRKCRRKYQAEMEAMNTKESRRAEKAKRAADREAEKQQQTAATEVAEEQIKPKRGLFGRKKADSAKPTSDEAAKPADSAAEGAKPADK